MKNIQKITKVPNRKTLEELLIMADEEEPDPIDPNMETAFVTFYKKLPK